MAMILGYWNIRGLAHAIRLLLEYTETPYEDKQYSGGEGPDFDTSQWTSVKETLGLDFPNLPYLIDGETKITQSNAILRYLARKYNMYGESEEEIIKMDMLENHLMDLRMSFARLCYNPDFEKLKPEYLEQLPGILRLFSRFLGDREWFIGNKITYVDFIIYDFLDHQRMFEPKCLDQFTNLRDFLDRFELAHSIRLLLEYTGTPYEEKIYRFGEAPDYDRSQWTSEKEKLGLDFPNLPYLIDGKTKFTQSNAILRYIARKHKMCGETEQEIIRVDMLENQVMDFSMSLAMVCYDPDFEKLKPGYLEQLPAKLKQFSQFLGERKWFVGDKITYVDFLTYDVLDINRTFEPKCLNQFKNLQDFLARFEALEKISAYMNSSRFIKTPIYTRIAKWGNKKE